MKLGKLRKKLRGGSGNSRSMYERAFIYQRTTGIMPVKYRSWLLYDCISDATWELRKLRMTAGIKGSEYTIFEVRIQDLKNKGESGSVQSFSIHFLCLLCSYDCHISSLNYFMGFSFMNYPFFLKFPTYA